MRIGDLRRIAMHLRLLCLLRLLWMHGGGMLCLLWRGLLRIVLLVEEHLHVLRVGLSLLLRVGLSLLQRVNSSVARRLL